MPIPRPSADAAAARLRFVTKDEHERTLNRLRQYPAAGKLWSSDRPDLGFGVGEELTWSHTGDGSTVTFDLAGRLTTRPARYVVLIGGVQQSPAAYSLPADAETIVFVAPPPSGETIAIHAPFYGASA